MEQWEKETQMKEAAAAAAAAGPAAGTTDAAAPGAAGSAAAGSDAAAAGSSPPHPDEFAAAGNRDSSPPPGAGGAAAGASPGPASHLGAGDTLPEASTSTADTIYSDLLERRKLEDAGARHASVGACWKTAAPAASLGVSCGLSCARLACMCS